MAVGSFANMGMVTGSTVASTLIGPNTVNTWVISVADPRTVNGMNFQAFPMLVGCTGNDMFQFGSACKSTGSIDGKAGANTLDYSICGKVASLNLATGAASLIAGSQYRVACRQPGRHHADRSERDRSLPDQRHACRPA